MNHLTILEQDLELSRKLSNYIIGGNKKVRLCNLSICVEEAIEATKGFGKDDILILDLDLKNRNGLMVIDKLKEKRQHMPYIIAITSDQEQYQQLPTYYPCLYAIVQKPFTYHQILQIIENITQTTSQKYYETLARQELRKFDINVMTKGYAYMVDCIVLALQDETLLDDMTHKLFQSVSIKRDNLDIQNIKWALEKCVKSIIRYTDASIMQPYFYVVDGEKITTKMFIGIVADNIREKLEQEEYA